ncbi:short chain dehydrogenase family protein [Colletotrichum tofieldiae]|nr:short chain dehydrogenase family protein [Colletotrichum tofieldiae]
MGIKTLLDEGHEVILLRRLLRVNVMRIFNCLEVEMRRMIGGGSIWSHHASVSVAAYISCKYAPLGLIKVAAFEGSRRHLDAYPCQRSCPDSIDMEMLSKPFDNPAGYFWLSVG